MRRPKLKEHMQFCVEHPEEMNKISKIKSQVAEVKGIMMDNIEKVLHTFYEKWKNSKHHLCDNVCNNIVVHVWIC